MALLAPNGGWADIAGLGDWVGDNTILMSCFVVSMDSGWGALFSKESSGITTQLSFYRHSDSDSLTATTNDSTNLISGSSVSGIIGRTAVIGITTTNAASPAYECYIDGVNIGSAAAQASQASGTGVLGLGRARDSTANYDSHVYFYGFMRWNRHLSSRALESLSSNIWQIFEDEEELIWIPEAGGGGVTIACTPGNATTTGITAGISAATTIACNVGNASTAGISAGITQAIVIACNAGTATTAGVSASISLDSSITITCTAGNATTAGISAVFPQTLSCTPGNATTAGNSATFPQTLSCNVGNATTAGITAQVDIAGQIVIGCNAGTATTTGVSANISSAFVLTCNAGTATTLGTTAYFPQSLQCNPGNAIALGIDATFTVAGPTTIVCNVGNATASGISFSFGGTLVDAPNGAGPAIIRPQTNRPPNIGGIRI
ncbi:hypothetical protein [Propionivibrio sp.]|uniref:hypothetical protein n=1 Tax=Propionivibrio sp. TaxID=2212460 RepID=UPI0025E3CCAE|nr:hypothetical protein [Propionivibrio sp.]MBK8745654.1 hypothetical protein [Propionivibrio sp.]